VADSFPYCSLLEKSHVTDPFDSSNKVAVITGPPAAPGRAIAKRMEELGAKIIISSRPDNLFIMMQLKLQRFEGEKWVVFGNLIDTWASKGWSKGACASRK
jgi:NADP-dependent 3-hydroxy acid dehydrogenase YdfG